MSVWFPGPCPHSLPLSVSEIGAGVILGETLVFTDGVNFILPSRSLRVGEKALLGLGSHQDPQALLGARAGEHFRIPAGEGTPRQKLPRGHEVQIFFLGI